MDASSKITSSHIIVANRPQNGSAHLIARNKCLLVLVTRPAPNMKDGAECDPTRVFKENGDGDAGTELSRT